MSELGELDADAYPVVAEVVNAAHRAVTAWNDLIEVESSDPRHEGRAISFHESMVALNGTLAEVYKVIPGV